MFLSSGTLNVHRGWLLMEKIAKSVLCSRHVWISGLLPVFKIGSREYYVLAGIVQLVAHGEIEVHLLY